MRLMTRTVRQMHRAVFSGLAKRLEVYILAGLHDIRPERRERLRPDLYVIYLPRLYRKMGEATIATRE